MQAANFPPIPLLSPSSSFISQSSFQPFTLSITAFAQENSAFYRDQVCGVEHATDTCSLSRSASASSLSHLFLFAFNIVAFSHIESSFWHRRTLACLSVPLHSVGVPAEVLRLSLVLEADSRTFRERWLCTATTDLSSDNRKCDFTNGHGGRNGSRTRNQQSRSLRVTPDDGHHNRSQKCSRPRLAGFRQRG